MISISFGRKAQLNGHRKITKLSILNGIILQLFLRVKSLMGRKWTLSKVEVVRSYGPPPQPSPRAGLNEISENRQYNHLEFQGERL
jgi:hypothetical protein